MAKPLLPLEFTFWHRAYQAALREARDDSGSTQIDLAVIVCKTELMEAIKHTKRYPEYRAIATALSDVRIFQILTRIKAQRAQQPQ